MKIVNPLTTNVTRHIETSQLIFNPNQLTCFYMTGNIGHSWVDGYNTFYDINFSRSLLYEINEFFQYMCNLYSKNISNVI